MPSGSAEPSNGPTDEAIAWFDHDAHSYAARNAAPCDRLQDFATRVKRGGRILDVGCGPGVDSGALAHLGFRVTGIDAAARMIEVARRRVPGVEFRVEDVRRLALPADSFDGILAAYSLIFLPKAQVPGVLAVLVRALRREGALMLVVQGGTPRDAGMGGSFSVMRPEEASALVAAAGLHVEWSLVRPPRPTEMRFDKVFVIGRKP